MTFIYYFFMKLGIVEPRRFLNPPPAGYNTNVRTFLDFRCLKCQTHGAPPRF